MNIILFAAVIPFVIWPIEIIFPYPYIVEELAKTVLVFFILGTRGRSLQIKLTILAGLFFAFSESVLYISNILLVGTLWTYLERLLLTIPLHILTSLLILLSGSRKKELLPLGVVMAMILHYFFNLFVSRL